ncbi:MAG: bifunctional precorrin-2 dehydrogenase/sirohydrochlorin ferrochelatase [Thermodesulfovibrionales bacterium]
MTLPYYPAFVDLTGKSCIVVGGGKVAERKVLSLLRSGASVTVISPDLSSPLRRQREKGALEHRERNYRKGDLRNAFLVIAATSDEGVNRRVAEDAPCLVNVVDNPEISSFIVPSLIRRGPLSIAVSTSGASPAMAMAMRAEMESLYPKELGQFLEFLRGIRKKALKEIGDREIREEFLRWAGSAELLERLREKGLQELKGLVQERFAKKKRGIA